MEANQKITFALAGELVDTPAQAKRILVDAVHHDKHWLIPQAESVLKQLRNAALIAAAALTLTACGNGDHATTATTLPTATVAPVIIDTQEPTPAPAPTPAPTPAPAPAPAPICPQSTAAVCPPSPYPAPRPPTVIGEPIFTCVRNSDPLVLVDGVLTDNCGSKYGAVTS